MEATQTWHEEDAPFKARHVEALLRDNKIEFESLADVGCGVGTVLRLLSDAFADARFTGYDITEVATAAARERHHDLRFETCGRDLADVERHDVALALDVFEHVPDYMGWLESFRDLARYKIYHVPLDIHCSGVIRGNLTAARLSVGHLHYFTRGTALATLEDTGHRIIDWRWTAGAFEGQGPGSLKKTVANVPRWLVSRASVRFAQRLFGGWSLMVLCE